MKKNIENHIDESLLKIRKIFEAAAEKIEAIELDKRLPATELAKDLGEQFNLEGPQIYPTIKFLLENYPNIKIKRGAHGGIHRISENIELVEDSKNSDVETICLKTEG